MTETPSIARGAAVGVATVVAERAVAFGVVLVLARALGAEDFGRWGYVLAGLTLVQVLVDQGVEMAAVAARSAEPGARVVGAVLRWRAVVWAFLALPVGALVLPAAGGGPSGVTPAMGLAGSVLVLVGPSITARNLRRATGDLPGMARVALADATTGAAAVLAAALAGWSVAGVLLARGAASIAVSAACLALTRGEGAGRAVAMRDLGPVAGPLALSALLIAVQTRAGHLVTMSLAGPVTVAALAAASRVTEVLGVLPEGALLALFPRMAAAPAAAATLAARAARLLAAVVLVPILVLSVAGGWVMRTLFGPGFEAAGGAAAILAWTALLSVTGGVVLHALVAGGRQRSLAVANVVAAAGGVALQLVLVGRFGLAGAAAATLATAVLGQATLLAMPSTRAAVVSVWQAVVPLAVLALVIALATAATRTDLLGAGVAVAAYVALALATGLVDARDVGALRAAATRRG